MRSISLKKLLVSDALEFLDLVLKALKSRGEKYSGIESFFEKLTKAKKGRLLKEEEALRLYAIVSTHSLKVEPKLWTKCVNRVRKRRERRSLTDQISKFERVEVSPETRVRLDKLKLKKGKKGGLLYPTYNDAIKRLLKSYDKEKKRARKLRDKSR